MGQIRLDPLAGASALAARAGAVMADLEFIQFHPTALDSKSSPLKLISEAVRGEGAILVDGNGDRFMAGCPRRASLRPAISLHVPSGGTSRQGHRVFLDARGVKGPRLCAAFPGHHGTLSRCGIDPVTQPIPVRPAARTTAWAAYWLTGPGGAPSTVLWACGEAACTLACMAQTGSPVIHLLEAAVCGGCSCPEYCRNDLHPAASANACPVE